VRTDPNAVLKVTEAAVAKIIPEPIPHRVLRHRKVKQNQMPSAVPLAPPANLRVAAAQGTKAPGFGES